MQIQDLMHRRRNSGRRGPGLPLRRRCCSWAAPSGKSAQLPLQTWLPDAMAGPTPASALIHAATMVTAGVYLIARTHVLFALAPAAQFAVAVVGAATLLLAGCSALTQHDIKRVLAYSTISQIGYMFLALGVGAWSAAIFHFVTHAFFKALLFLGAGVIIERSMTSTASSAWAACARNCRSHFGHFSSPGAHSRACPSSPPVSTAKISSSGERGRRHRGIRASGSSA